MAPKRSKRLNPYMLDANERDDRLLLEMHSMMKHVFGGPNYKTIEGKLDMYTWPCLIWEPNSVEPENRKGVHVFLRFTEDYPRVAPLVYLRDSYHDHPHVREHNCVTSQLLSGRKWDPETTVEQILTHVREVLGHTCSGEGPCDM